MKKLIALVAVVTMLFGIVGTASAYDVAMSILVVPDLIQWGPTTPDHMRAQDADVDIMVSPSVPGFTTAVNINVFGSYGDLKKWYNYTNSNTQEAWIRIPIVIDSTDKLDFPHLNTKSTSFGSADAKLIQQGSIVTINGVNYPVGVIAGFTKSSKDYGPFYGGSGAYDLNAAVNTSDADQTAIGVYYPVRLMQGGSTEQLNISYTPNGVEEYKATITITYADSASSNNAAIASKTGANVSYFNAGFNSALDVLAFDNVLKSGNMIHENVLYKFADYSTSWSTRDDDHDSSTKFPTIVMQAKIQLRDTNGNPLPVRTQMLTTVDGNDGDVPSGFRSTMNSFIADGTTNTADNAVFMFCPEDVASKTFSATTKTDDQVYSELDSNGSFTVTVRVIDNSSSIVNAALKDFMTTGAAANTKIIPYFSILDTTSWDAGVLSGVTIEGVKNRVNYKYVEGISQRVYTYSAMNMQSLSYDINLNSLDRIQAPSISIVGDTSNMTVGSTRQLSATTTNNATDNIQQWSSSNTNVATVNSTGLVTAVSNGTTYITVRYAVGGEFNTVAITVADPAPVVTEAPAPTTTQYFVAVGSSSSLNVRSGANTKSARVGRLKRGDTVNVYEIVDGWAKIDYNGSIAYVSSRYISQ